jgi:hypothetical protein
VSKLKLSVVAGSGYALNKAALDRAASLAILAKARVEGVKADSPMVPDFLLGVEGLSASLDLPFFVFLSFSCFSLPFFDFFDDDFGDDLARDATTCRALARASFVWSGERGVASFFLRDSGAEVEATEICTEVSSTHDHGMCRGQLTPLCLPKRSSAEGRPRFKPREMGGSSLASAGLSILTSP